MKPKALNKRLVLKRETIVNLSETEMGRMFGGIYYTHTGCSIPLNSCLACHPSCHFSECVCLSTNPEC